VAIRVVRGGGSCCPGVPQVEAPQLVPTYGCVTESAEEAAVGITSFACEIRASVPSHLASHHTARAASHPQPDIIGPAARQAHNTDTSGGR